MANEQNLRPKPWKPGQSGNPAGSSKKQRLTTRLLRILDEQELDGPFIQAGVNAALGGDFQFWRYIFDRIDGPPSDEEAAKLKEVVDALIARRRNGGGDSGDPGSLPR